MSSPFFSAGLSQDSPADIVQRINEAINGQTGKIASDAAPTTEELLALERMRKERLCPSKDKLLGGGAAVQRHLEYCDACKERLASFSKPLNFGGLPKLAPASETPLKAGQIRDIKKAASGKVDIGSDEWLFNPPMVLIIQAPGNDRPFARVAQMHNEYELAGPGDIPVEISDDIFFIESWNTYPILPEFLGPVLGNAPQAVVDTLLESSEQPLPEVSADSPIEAFRELEIKTGYHFNQKSWESGLAAFETLGQAEAPGKAKLIPFSTASQKTQVTSQTVKNIYLKKIILPFGIAACLCLMIATWIRNPQELNSGSVQIPEQASLPQKSNSGTVQISEQASLQIGKNFSVIFSLLAQGGLDAVRGEEKAIPLAWEEESDPKKEINAQDKAFAAGEWSARARISKNTPPFPQKWLVKPNGVPEDWADNPYYDLGMLAFSADLACKTKNTAQLEKSFAGVAGTLRERIGKADKTADAFLAALNKTPISCAEIGDFLDEFDDRLR